MQQHRNAGEMIRPALYERFVALETNLQLEKSRKCDARDVLQAVTVQLQESRTGEAQTHLKQGWRNQHERHLRITVKK